MKRSFKAGLLTVCMTALATAPIVTITTFAAADAAYAKGGNGNGGGNSNAGGNGNGQGKDKSASARSGGDKVKGPGKGQGKTRSASKGGPKTLGEFFQKLTGQDKKASRASASRDTGTTKSARKTIPAEIAEAPAKRGGKRIAGMHPSQLGNMNGALNANINAVLAHIRNGNTNGPVGLVAGLAVAKIAAEGQQDVLDVENAYLLLDDALVGTPYEVVEGGPYTTAEEALAAYLAATNSPETEAVETALSNLEGAQETDDIPALEAALVSALADAGYPTDPTDPDAALQSYRDDVEAAELAADVDIDAAIAGLVTETGDPLERPTSDELDTAALALEDLTLAEVAIIETWNKSDAANEEDTAALLDALHGRITENDAAIRSTIEAIATEPVDGDIEDPLDDLADCDDGEVCEEDELEELASAN